MVLNLKILSKDKFSGEATGRLENLIGGYTDAKSLGKKAARHSSLVRILRLALPLIALAIVVIMLAWGDMENTVTAIPKADIAPESIGRNELLNPRFESEDKDRQPYTITATKAFQESNNLDLIRLQKPVADMNLKDGSWIALEAESGLYDQVKQTLTLEGHVKLFHDDGYELLMERVDLDLNAQTAISTSDVSGHGPLGTIRAKGLRADGTSGTLTFTGHSVLTLHQDDPKNGG
jgi:lipopolysaccharide export system protein LptC